MSSRAWSGPAPVPSPTVRTALSRSPGCASIGASWSGCRRCRAMNVSITAPASTLRCMPRYAWLHRSLVGSVPSAWHSASMASTPPTAPCRPSSCRTPSKPDVQSVRHPVTEGSTRRAIRRRIKSQRCGMHTEWPLPPVGMESVSAPADPSPSSRAMNMGTTVR